MQRSGLGFKRTLGVGNTPVLQRDKGFLLAQGGFVLNKTGLLPGNVLREGTPLIFNEADRTVTLIPFVTLQASAANNAVNYRVKKGGTLKLGDKVFATEGGAAYAITAITTSNPDYDQITLGTTLGETLAQGATLFTTTAAAGATAVDLPGGINGLLYDDLVVEDGIQQTVSAIIRGTVYARRTAYSAQLAALPGLAHIIYSQSY